MIRSVMCKPLCHRTCVKTACSRYAYINDKLRAAVNPSMISLLESVDVKRVTQHHRMNARWPNERELNLRETSWKLKTNICTMKSLLSLSDKTVKKKKNEKEKKT